MQNKGFRRGAWLAVGGRSFLQVLRAIRITPLSYHRGAFFPSSLLQTSCCFSYLCSAWATRLALCHHFRLDASCRVYFVQRSARIPTKQLTSNTIHHQSCGTDLWRWVPVDLRAVEVWIPGAWTGGRAYSDESQANLAMAYTSQSSLRAREKLLQTSFNT